MFTVVITACSILFSGGPISSFNAPELKNGTCREFKERFNPEYSSYGLVDQPIIIDQTTKEIPPEQCMREGQIAISKWLPKHPGVSINKWRCEPYSDREDI